MEQPIDPLTEIVRDGQKKPAIAVYVQEVEGQPESGETQSGPRMVTLKVVIYSPPSVSVDDNGVTLDFDDHAGLLLNLMGRQVTAAMHYGNSAWVELFRRFIVGPKVETIKSRFLLIEIEAGVRIPAMEMEFYLSAIPEPEFGRALYGVWAALDTQLRTIPNEGNRLADLFKALIENPSDLPAFEQYQIATNLSNASYLDIGLAPLATGDDGEPVNIEEVDADPNITITPPSGVE
jgi:hypothetical protein